MGAPKGMTRVRVVAEHTNIKGISQAGVAREWAVTPRVPGRGQEEAEAQWWMQEQTIQKSIRDSRNGSRCYYPPSEVRNRLATLGPIVVPPGWVDPM